MKNGNEMQIIFDSRSSLSSAYDLAVATITNMPRFFSSLIDATVESGILCSL